MRKLAGYGSRVLWVGVFAGIALAGIIMLICYAVWLAHKAGDLWSEIDVLADRADQLAELVDQIKVPERVYLPDLSDRTITP
jgi:hypothetical protein